MNTKNNIKPMEINITAYDMLFFGTGRPFTMEDESWTIGVFPPYPSTIYGYLRSTYFENNMDDFKHVNKESDPTSNFKIQASCILLVENDKNIAQLYPIPFGHVFNEKGQIEPLDLTKDDFVSNNPFEYSLLANSTGKKETIDNTIFVSKKQLENYLQGLPIEGYCKITEYLTTEERIGISKNLTLGKTAEGRLYRISFNHLSKLDFGKNLHHEIQFKLKLEANLPNEHTRNLGGEGKYALLKQSSFEDIKQPTINKEAVLYFNTPAIFDKALIEDYAIIQTIANDTAIMIGGWDIQKRMPKPSKKAYPAGSVFYITFKNDTLKQEFLTKYKSNQIGELTEQGFGEFYIGNQKNN